MTKITHFGRWRLGRLFMALLMVVGLTQTTRAQMMAQNDDMFSLSRYYWENDDYAPKNEPSRTGTTFYYQVLSNLDDYSGEYIFARNAYNGMCSGLKAKDAAHTEFVSDYSYPTTSITVSDYKITSGADDCVVIKIEKEASGYSLFNTTTEKYIDVAAGGHLVEVTAKPTEFWYLSYSANMVTMRRTVGGTSYYLKNTYNVSPFEFNLSLTSSNGGTAGYAPRIYKKTNVSYKTIPESTTYHDATFEYRPFLCNASGDNKKSYTQAIYTPDEMNVSGKIVSIAYNYYGTNSLKDSHVIDIYMAEIASDYRFDATTNKCRRFVPLSGQTLVYSGTITGWTSGWREIILTTPFEYSGDDDKSLLVTVYKKSKTGSTDGDSNTGFYYHDYGATGYADRKFASANYTAVDNIIGHETEVVTSGVSAPVHRPQIRFGMEAKLNIEAVAEDSFVTEVKVAGDGQTGTLIKVEQGSEVTFTATLDDCRIFTGWYNSANVLVSTDNPYVFTPTDDITLTAKSTENTGSYNITVSAGSNGSLNGAYSGSYTCGDQIEMSVTPDAGYSFSGWYDGTTFLSDENPYIYHVTGDADITAYFAPPMNITPVSGTYAYGTVATMETTIGATIYYTTDGTTPSEDNYDGTGTSPLQLSLVNNTVLKAVGKVNGSYTSIVTRNYVVPVEDYTGDNPDGLVLSKSIDDPANPSLLTLESYVSGKTITKTERTPVDVVFVMDFSSSMSSSIGGGGTRFNAMKDAVTKFLNVLKNNPSSYPEVPHRVAFVPFGEYGTLCYNSGSQYNPVFATAKSNKYKALSVPTSDISTSLYSKAFLNMVTPNAFGTGYVSNYTNVNNFWVNKVCALGLEGWTYTHIGINVAEKILQNNSSYGISESGEVINRKRIVIILTDGGIGGGHWYYTTGDCEDHCATDFSIVGSESNRQNMSEMMANISLLTTNRMKNEQDALVYTFGIYDGADASGSLPSYNTTDYDHSMESNCVVYQTEHGTAADNNVNRHMHLLSSNYPNATCMGNGNEGIGANAGYFLSPSSSTDLSNQFENIATSAVASMNLSSEAVVQDVIGDNFVLPAGADVSDIEVYYANCTATSPVTFGTPQVLTGANVQIGTDNKHIIVNGFDFSENWVGDNSGVPHGAKLIIKIPIAPDPDFDGVEGDYPTNAAGSCVYDEMGNPVAAFTSPTAHVTPTVIHLWTQAVTSYSQTVISETPTFVVNDVAKTIEISSEQALAWLISYVNGYNGESAHNLSGYTVTITKDLDMSEYVWVPIGYTTTLAFQGTFDGNYQTIDGIHIANTTEVGYVEGKHGAMNAAGMFGYTKGIATKVTIKNTFLTSGSMTCDEADGCLGGLVGNADNTTIEFCESALALTAEGALSAVGGIAGQASNSTINAVMAVGDITFNASVVNAGCITGLTDGTLMTFYANQNISGSGTVTTKNTTGTNGYTRTNNTDYNMGIQNFTPVSLYTYGSYNTNNTVADASGNKVPLVDSLNKNVASGYKWMRSTSQAINGDYPIIVKSANDGMAIVNANTTGKVVRYGDINALLGMEKYQNADHSVYMYNNYEISTAPVSTELYIDEHVAMTQSASCDPITAHVGITLKNPKGKGEMSRDWHMFSTSLQNPPLGILYRAGNQTHTEYAPGDDNFLSFGENLDYWIDENGYFPTNITDRTQFDFYSYYEPEYHWINLKRKPNNHWHEDEIDGAHPNIAYNGENGQTELEQGKGYLVALGNTSDNNNLMQAKGVLNNGIIDIDVTNNGDHLTGYNLLGNPYQSYLDFVEFATYGSNADNLWKADTVGTRAFMIYDAEQGGYVEYLMDGDETSFSMGAEKISDQYIHPHQSFFVVKNIDEQGSTPVRFNNDMRDTTAKNTVFRSQAPTYPLVNLECTDSEGKWEHSVIEFERPLAAGSLKMKGMLNSKANMYIHWNGVDYGSVFIDYMPDYVPVWFETSEDGVFTFTWNTANANFGYMHLIDHLTGTDYDCLAPGNDHYTFEAKTTDMAARFRLVFKPLGIDENEVENANFAFFNGEQLIVNGSGDMQLIDVNGRILMTEHLSGEQNSISLPNLAAGVYMLRMIGDSESRIQKIVVRK